jgi:hypothetical protein
MVGRPAERRALDRHGAEHKQREANCRVSAEAAMGQHAVEAGSHAHRIGTFMPASNARSRQETARSHSCWIATPVAKNGASTTTSSTRCRGGARPARSKASSRYCHETSCARTWPRTRSVLARLLA